MTRRRSPPRSRSIRDGASPGLARRICDVRGWPIRAYFLMLVLLFVAAAGAATVYVRGQADRDARRDALDDATFAGDTAAKQLGTFLQLTRDSVKGLADNPRIGQTFVQPSGCTLSFAGIGGPDRGHLDVVSSHGAVACSSRARSARDLASGYGHADWLRQALERPVFVAPVVDAVTGAWVAISAEPIPGGKGVVAAFADLGALGPQLASQYGGGRPVEFVVTSGDGRKVIARSIDARRWVGASVGVNALAGGTERPDLDGRSRIYARTSVPGVGWRFYTGEDRAEVLVSANRLANRQLAIILVGLAAFLLAACLGYLNLVRPISRLRLALRHSSGSPAPAPVPTAGPAEIKGLAADINGLIASVDRELSRRQQAEETLEASARDYRLLFESNPNPMWVFDVETLRFLAVNEAAIENYGYSREEFLAMTIADIRPPEDVPLLEGSVWSNGDRTAVGFYPSRTWRHRRKDGTLIEAEVTSHGHEFEGTPARVVLALDVTDLRASEARYRELFENATDLIATTDLEGRLTDVNRAFVNALGYSREELEGKALLELVPPESHPRLAQARESKLADGSAGTVYEHELIAKDGSLIQVEVSSRLVEKHGRPTGIEAICRDVSERKTLEDQLRQAQRLEAVGQLAGGIAHDFNNLLTVIHGYTELLANKGGQAGRSVELEQIAGASHRAAALTRQLLAFSRRQVLQPRVIDMNEVVGNLAPMLERVLGEHLEFAAELDGDLHHIVADPGQIEQVLMNLAVNARDAMPQGGKLTIETRNTDLDGQYAATHDDAVVGPHAMLAVSDTGVGMDPETLARVFEPFFTTKEVGSGTGLGLATVHGIVKQSGGNIWVYSEPGEGTTFKIYFPAVNAELTQEPEASASTSPTGSETILVVEDEPSLRNLVAEMLVTQGYRVLTAATPLDAFEVVDQHEIDLLLTDLIMPQLSGRELAEQIVQRFPGLSVLFMSGYADAAANRNGALREDAAYLEKPFSSAELAHKVRSVLDSGKKLGPSSSYESSLLNG